jgi:hypothetical protein
VLYAFSVTESSLRTEVKATSERNAELKSQLDAAHREVKATAGRLQSTQNELRTAQDDLHRSKLAADLNNKKLSERLEMQKHATDEGFALLDKEVQRHKQEVPPCHICTGTGFTPAHICTGTRLAPATSAPGLGAPFAFRPSSHSHFVLRCAHCGVAAALPLVRNPCAATRTAMRSGRWACMGGRRLL